MGVIDDVLSGDAFAFFDADVMPGVEAIVYTPQGGTPQVIDAQVTRIGMSGMAGIPAFVLRIAVENHVTRGIASTTMKIGADTVAVSPRPGGSARTYQLPQIDADSDSQVLRFTLEGAGY